jgi:L-gulonolactone oxidase
MVELTVLRDRKLPQVQAKFAWVQDAVEQLTLCKYKGRPHFGKNFDRTYQHPGCPVRDNLYDFQGLLDVRARYDPDKVKGGRRGQAAESRGVWSICSRRAGASSPLIAHTAKHQPTDKTAREKKQVFEPPLMTRVIARAANALHPRCALQKECYCQEDIHCGEGFRCVPSSAFPEYKACRPAELKALFGR